MKGKKTALLLPAGSGAGDCDLTIEMIKRICKSLEMGYLGEVISESYNVGDVSNDANAVPAIMSLSAIIIEALKN